MEYYFLNKRSQWDLHKNTKYSSSKLSIWGYTDTLSGIFWLKKQLLCSVTLIMVAWLGCAGVWAGLPKKENLVNFKNSEQYWTSFGSDFLVPQDDDIGAERACLIYQWYAQKRILISSSQHCVSLIPKLCRYWFMVSILLLSYRCTW